MTNPKEYTPSRPFSDEIFWALPKVVRDYIIGMEHGMNSLTCSVEELTKNLGELTKHCKELGDRNQVLENRLNQNSTNSNRPPSTDSPFDKKPAKGTCKTDEKTPQKVPEPSETQEAKVPEPSETQEGKEGDTPKKPKRPARHPGATQPTLPPTEERTCEPSGVCPHCGCHDMELSEAGVFQHIDLATLLLNVIHFHIMQGQCRHCGHTIRGVVPQEFSQPYGANLTALIAYLDSQTCTTRRQLQELLRDVFGLPISQGGIQNCIDKASSAIEPHYNLIGKGIQGCAVANIDETSWRTFGPMRKHLHWLWVMACEFLAFFMIHAHRSSEAFRILVGAWKGYLISDDYAPYRSWEHGRQTCLAHLIRKAKGFVESINKEEARFGKRLLSAFTKLCELEGTHPGPGPIISLRARLARLVTDFRHNKKLSKLAKRLLNEFDSLIFFLSHPDVEKTNNHAERMLRSPVCVRKVSIGSTSRKGEIWVERSLTVRKTCALNKISYYKTLVDAVASQTRRMRPHLYPFRKICARVAAKADAMKRAN